MSAEDSVESGDSRLVFPALDSPLLLHGVFDRRGGVSPPPWDSRNVAYGVGDRPAHVRANRELIKQKLGCRLLVAAGQVHGSRIYRVKERPAEDLEVDGFDGLITNVAGVGLMIQQADCQAVMLFDPGKKAVGIAHAGWRGSVANIIGETVSAMNHAFKTNPVDLIAAVSPSLGPCCAEFINFRTELPTSFHNYQVRPDYFDFWAISLDQLRAAGIKTKNIHSAEICTRCNRDYFSYRRDRLTGRFASVIGLREKEMEYRNDGVME